MALKRNGIVFGLSLLLLACTSLEPTEHSAVSVENFTTAGKPTKTVQTPWGDKQVYDPTQDPEVIAAFEYVYRTLPDTPENQREKFYEYQDFFSEISKIQLYDLSRIGCRKPLYSEYTDLEFDTHIHNKCQLIDYGSPTLNVCEADNINQTGNLKSVIAAFKMIGEDAAGNTVWQRDFEGLGLKKHYKTKPMAFDMYFKAECRAFNQDGGE